MPFRSSGTTPDYISSPDMAAFTIGRVVIASLATGRPFTESCLLTRLAQIAAGDTKHIPENGGEKLGHGSGGMELLRAA